MQSLENEHIVSRLLGALNLHRMSDRRSRRDTSTASTVNGDIPPNSDADTDADTEAEPDPEPEPDADVDADDEGGDDATAATPVFRIIFRDEQVARKYNRPIKRYLQDLIKKRDLESEDCDVSTLQLDIWEESPEEEPPENSLDDSALFMIDKCPAQKDELDVPTYSQKYSGILKYSEETPKEKTKERSCFQTCFNCLGDHCLRDCPNQRDGATIARNRRAFMNKHGNQKTSRYHQDDEQRFAHIIPGEISDALRRALGLSRHELPRHIYQMRVLGYPPGWLEEAKVSYSGIALFDSQGQEVAHPEDEDGEIVSEQARDKYDLKKIISFPGFNVKPKSGTRDEFEYLGFPPMDKSQSKEVMLAKLEPNSVQAYRKRRVLPVMKSKSEGPVQAPSDMEVEEMSETVTLLPADDCRFIPPLPKETPPRPPPPPSTESDSEGGETRSQEPCSPLSTQSVVVQGHSSMSSPRAQSPSLSDLEMRKRQLLAELEDGGSSSDTAPQKSSPTTTVSSTLGRVKSMSLGTPLLKSSSPYSSLPHPEKFSKDICDVINFENLPDATGKYEKMSGIIKKVRRAVQQIQNESDK